MIKRIIVRVLNVLDYLITHYCLCRHHYDTKSKECWECGYACREEEEKTK
jgi:hypothetical protein